jgi:hypothetical protein
VSIGTGCSTPPVRRRLHLNAPVGVNFGLPAPPAPENSVTIRFRVGKWTGKGEMADLQPNEISEIPVTFTAVDLASVKAMNDKVTAAINNDGELNRGKNLQYYIYKSINNKTLPAKLRDYIDIQCKLPLFHFD